MASWAVCVAFWAATQDIAMDAWRIESAGVQMQGAMAAAYQIGYRIALIAAVPAPSRSPTAPAGTPATR